MDAHKKGTAGRDPEPDPLDSGLFKWELLDLDFPELEIEFEDPEDFELNLDLDFPEFEDSESWEDFELNLDLNFPFQFPELDSPE